MDSKEILQSIIENFFSNTNQNLIYLSISERLMNMLGELLGSDVTVIDLQDNFSPLKPFMEILKNSSPDSKTVKQASYKLQQEAFCSYFKTGKPKPRLDLVIREEVVYEKNRIKNTVVELLKKYMTGKFVILNSQLLSEEGIEILKSVEKSEFPGKIAFCINGLRLEECTENIREYFQSVSNNNNYYSIMTSQDFDDRDIRKKDRLKIEYQDLLHVLRVYKSFLALGEGYSLVKQIDTDTVLRNYEKEENRYIYMEMGLICYFKNDLDLANYYFNMVIEMEVGDELEQFAYYYLASVSYLKNMNSLAIRYINKNKQIFRENTKSPAYVYTMMIEYIVMERISDNYSINQYLDVLNLLDKNGCVNNKIYTSLVIPWSVVYQKPMRDKMFVKVKEAYAEAERIDNRFGLSTACHWMGICLAHEGKKKESYEWYSKCRALREEMDDTAAINKVSNGLSYEFLNDADYKKSYNLINSFIGNLLDSDDYPEIIITLGNVGRALFYARNFEPAYEVFQKIINLLYIFDLQDIYFNSFMPEYNDVMTYKSIIDFFRGDYTRAKMNLHNIMHNGKYFTPIDEILKFFLNACIDVEEKNIQHAIEVFEHGVESFQNVGNTQEHRLVFMFYEFALILNKAGYEKEANEYKERGFQLAKERGLNYYTKGKAEITLFDYLEGIEKFDPLNLDLSALEERAEKERLLNQLHKRLRDSQFLSKLMNYSIDTFNFQKYVSNASQTVFDYIMADAVFIAEKGGKCWNILASSTRGDQEEPEEKLWNELLGETTTITPDHIKKEKDRDLLFINLKKFDFVGGIIIYLQKKMWLSAEEMNTLNLAVNNIQSQLVMFKQNEHLTMISSTDPLSQLKNRHALQEQISFETELLERYEKKQHGSMYESVAFVDLDNFKYYNDTFGHEAGDLLISCMGRILNEVFRKVDFVARYGGDEFVVMMPKTDCLEAKRSGERLREALVKARYFIPDLEHLLNRNINIPEDKIFGFSIGISCTTDNTDVTSIEEAMTKADHALYYSKQTKKGSISIWSEIKDKIDINDENRIINKRS